MLSLSFNSVSSFCHSLISNFGAVNLAIINAVKLENIDKQVQKRWEDEKRAKEMKEQRRMMRMRREQQRKELNPTVVRISQGSELDSPDDTSNWSRKKSEGKRSPINAISSFALRP